MIWMPPTKSNENKYWNEIVRAEPDVDVDICLLRNKNDKKWYISSIYTEDDSQDVGPYESLTEAKAVAQAILKLKGYKI